MSAHVDVAWGHDWGWLLGWLAGADGIDSNLWRTRFSAALNVDLLAERVTNGVADKIPGAVDFIHSLAQLAPLASSQCIRAITPEIARLIRSDLAAASRALVDWCFGEFIFAATILNGDAEEEDDADEADEEAAHDPGWRAVADAMSDLVNSVNWTSAGRSLSATKADLDDLAQFDVLGYSISHLAPNYWAEAMSAVDLDHLDQVSRGEWTPTPRVARLVFTLASGSDPSPGRRWARRHADELDHVPSFLAAADPQVAVEALDHGHPIVLSGSNGWNIAADAIEGIANVDPGAAAAALRENEDQILAAIRSDQSHLSEGIEHLVRTVDRVDPDWMNDRLVVMDLETLRAQWAERVDSGVSGIRTARFLLDRTSTLT